MTPGQDVWDHYAPMILRVGIHVTHGLVCPSHLRGGRRMGPERMVFSMEHRRFSGGPLQITWIPRHAQEACGWYPHHTNSAWDVLQWHEDTEDKVFHTS